MKTAFIFDVDGVLLDLWGPMGEAYSKYKNKNYSEAELVEIIKDYLVNPEPYREWGRFFQTLEVFENLKPLPGMVGLVKRLKDKKFDLYVVTAASEEEESKRVKNLEKVFGKVFEEIHCVGYACKTDALKGIAAQYEASYFCDDNPVNVQKSVGIVSQPIWFENGPSAFRQAVLDLSVVKIAKTAEDIEEIVLGRKDYIC